MSFDPQQKTFQIRTTLDSVLQDFGIYVKGLEKPVRSLASSADNSAQLESQKLPVEPGDAIFIEKLELRYENNDSTETVIIDDPQFIQQIPSFVVLKKERVLEAVSTIQDNLLWIALSLAALMFIPTGILVLLRKWEFVSETVLFCEIF